MENTSKLGYLMNLLDISGKELSEAVFVDITTVSKWKNRQRKLNYKSPYVRKMAQYFLSSEQQSKRGIITDILKLYIPDLNTGSGEQMTQALSLWLTDEKPAAMDAGGENASGRNAVDIFPGTAGIEQAFVKFWKYTLLVPPGQTILVTDYRDINFDEENPERITRIMQLFLDAAQYGHTIKIIDCATDEVRPYVAIFRWLPMYLSDNVEIWRLPEYYKKDIRISTFVLPNEIALSSIALEMLPDEHHNIIYQDKETVDFWQKSVLSVLSRSKKMIETIPAGDVLRMLEILDKNLNSVQQTYMLNPVPTFRNMKLSLLREILESNGVEEALIEICLTANRQTRAIRERCRYVQIYDLDAMFQMAGGPIIDYDLSAICNKEIQLTKEQFKQHVEYLGSLKNTDNYSMTLASFSALDLLSTQVSMIVQDDSLVVAWDPKRYKRRMVCKELVVINGFYKYMEELWQQIPPVCKSEEWRDKQFRRLIEMLA